MDICYKTKPLYTQLYTLLNVNLGLTVLGEPNIWTLTPSLINLREVAEYFKQPLM